MARVHKQTLHGSTYSGKCKQMHQLIVNVLEIGSSIMNKNDSISCRYTKGGIASKATLAGILMILCYCKYHIRMLWQIMLHHLLGGATHSGNKLMRMFTLLGRGAAM